MGDDSDLNKKIILTLDTQGGYAVRIKAVEGCSGSRGIHAIASLFHNNLNNTKTYILLGGAK